MSDAKNQAKPDKPATAKSHAGWEPPVQFDEPSRVVSAWEGEFARKRAHQDIEQGNITTLEVVKALVLINGGAAAAVFTLIGQGKLTPGGPIFHALCCYCAGLAAGLCAAYLRAQQMTAYGVWWQYQGNPHMWHKMNERYHESELAQYMPLGHKIYALSENKLIRWARSAANLLFRVEYSGDLKKLFANAMRRERWGTIVAMLSLISLLGGSAFLGQGFTVSPSAAPKTDLNATEKPDLKASPMPVCTNNCECPPTDPQICRLPAPPAKKTSRHTGSAAGKKGNAQAATGGTATPER